MSKFNARLGLSVGNVPITVIDASGNATFNNLLASGAMTGTSATFNRPMTASSFFGSGANLSALSLPMSGLSASGTASSSTFLRGDNAWQPITNGTATIPQAILPSRQGDVFDYNGLVTYINSIAIGRNYTALITAYSKVVTAVPYAYAGGVYSPTQNRIYFAPYSQATATSWHYIDCDTGSVAAYAKVVTGLVPGAYFGGVYSPTQNRIYFVPQTQASATSWHYINCATGSVVAYSHTGATAVAQAYLGGVYSPTQNRIYFVPNSQSAQAIWHYIDCDTGSVVAYTHTGATAVSEGYLGGAYSPTQNRIYFAPYYQSTAPVWHYINCDTGSVVAYTHGATAVVFAYAGGVYSPTQNRIYFVPCGQGAGHFPPTIWHYINCDTGSVVAYTHGATVIFLGPNDPVYYGGVYSPTQNRIYFVPSQQAPQAIWHYINCDTGLVVAYTHGATAAPMAYAGGAYSPTQNRIYFAPQNQASATSWHYIDCDTNSNLYPSKWLMAGPMFNKF